MADDAKNTTLPQMTPGQDAEPASGAPAAKAATAKDPGVSSLCSQTDEMLGSTMSSIELQRFPMPLDEEEGKSILQDL